MKPLEWSERCDQASARRRVVVAVVGEALVARLVVALRHRRGFGDRGVHLDHQVTQHRVAEPERAGQLVQRLAVALDVHQDVVGLVDLRDRERQLAPAPILEAMHDAVAGRDHALVALQHRWNLFTLVGMDQKNDLVMSHCCSSWICLPSVRETAVRQGVMKPLGQRARAGRA